MYNVCYYIRRTRTEVSLRSTISRIPHTFHKKIYEGVPPDISINKLI